jgi:hypothetical protein
LYWYLKVESEDEYSGRIFAAVYNCFLIQLERGPTAAVSSKWCLELRAQASYIASIIRSKVDEFVIHSVISNPFHRCQRSAKEERGKKEVFKFDAHKSRVISN